MEGSSSNMGKHLQTGTGTSLFYWSERVSEYTKEKVCDREKKTDVFSEKGGGWMSIGRQEFLHAPHHTHFSPIPSMWDLSAWVTLSYLGDKIGSLSLFQDVSLTHFLPTLPLMSVLCLHWSKSPPLLLSPLSPEITCQLVGVAVIR